ncbi:MAG: SDR family NAD(P)-dependent oxidoreductase, partial [Pseudomonadaceae bacterium]|nr:SDR family NAD(P)-dependent oxidoreductase [Pseudomonadaceae bacterium]
VIVQVGSALAYRAIPLQSAYCAAKFACRGFTDSLRVELQHDDSAVHVTSVHLAAFNTPQFDWARNRMPRRPQPVPPVFQPELAARAIVWASQQKRREVNVGFPAVKTIWGNKFAPPGGGLGAGGGRLQRPAGRAAVSRRPAGQPVQAGGQGHGQPWAFRQ